MVFRIASALLALVLVMPSGSASAQPPQVSLAFGERTIVLVARNATLRQILEEWERVGGAQVVNAEKLRSEPLTLLLRDVTEREALDSLLKEAGGYVMSARGANEKGLSAFRTIVLVPTGTSLFTDGTLPRLSDASATLGTPLAPPRYVEEPGEPAALVENVVVAPDQRPPTPTFRPPQRPDASNPFGVAGASTPGQAVSEEPPAGVAYPRVTNPDAALPGAVRLK